ncbi:hypothetical protein ACQJBY_052858 [Aegilops geniculata]
MALRNLVTKVRAPLSAALRPPSVSRGSPAVRSWPFSAAPRQGEQHGKRILDFESATEEEVVREARLLDKQINKNLSHIREYNENVMPRVLQGIYGKVKWFFGAGAVVELVRLGISARQASVGHSE